MAGVFEIADGFIDSLRLNIRLVKIGKPLQILTSAKLVFYSWFVTEEQGPCIQLPRDVTCVVLVETTENLQQGRLTRAIGSFYLH